MAKTINDILGLPRLMGLIQETTSGLPQEKILQSKAPGLLTVKQQIIGDTGQATLVKGQRKVTKLTRYNAPPVGVDLETIGIRNFKLLSTAEAITIDPVTFQNLRNYDNYEFQKQGAEEIGRQIALFKKKFDNNRISVLISVLNNGAVYFDSNGNLLPTASGADARYTVDMQVPAINKNQLNGIISQPWSLPSCNIPDQLQAIRQQAARAHGYVPTTIIYGRKVYSWILQNQYVQMYNVYNSFNQPLMGESMIPDGFLGFKWIDGSQFFYEDASGTNQPLVPDDKVILFPDVSSDWYSMVEGSMMLPTTLNILPTAEAALQATKIEYGMYVYAHMNLRPINLEIVGGDNFMPIPRVPEVLYQADVDF